MEPMLLSLFLIYVLICFSSLYFLFIFSTSERRSPQNPSVDPSKFPPGSTGWPIIGETIEFSNAEKFIKERMNKYSKHIFKTSVLGEPVAVFCGQDGNKFFFSNENKIGVPWYPRSIYKILTHMEKAEGTKESIKIISQFLTREALQRYLPIMDRQVKRHLVTEWDNKRKVTAWPLAMNFSLGLVFHLFLSIDDPAGIEELSALYKKLRAGLVSIPIDFPGTAYNRGIKASKLIMNKVMLIIKQRKIDLEEKRASPTQDILSHMLLLKVGGDGNLMDELDIASIITGLLFASHFPSATVITFIIKYLAELPSVYSEVRKEVMEIESSKVHGDMLNWDDIQKMKYSWNVAREVMRLVPPSGGTFREAIVDFNYKGFSVPKGWKMHWSPNSTLKNAEYFSEPEKFDPTRFEGNGPAPYRFAPFGGGQHLCPGRDLVKLQILVFMYHAVRKYKWETVLPDEEVDFILFPKPVDGLPILLQPHIV